jgi:hypothetical protein
MMVTRETLEAAGWRLTPEHGASSYGQVVLIAPDGDAIGSADLVSVLPDGTLAEDAFDGTGELVLGGEIRAALGGGRDE